MRIIVLIIVFIASGAKSFSQWENAGIPLLTQQVRTLCVDTAANKLYAAGAITLDGTGNYANNTICIYDGQNWSLLDTIHDLIYAMIIYNNELYIAGSPFLGMNGFSTPYLAKWDGVTWAAVSGINGGVIGFRIINSELYVMGSFTQIGGINANGIAVYNGTTWSDLHNFPSGLFSSNTVGDVAHYNGEWYVGGNFTLAPDTISDLAVYRNNQWQRVGVNDYLKGGFTNLWCMEVYNNELYVGGLIRKSDGNVGHGIQKWNGTFWNEVGTGLKNQNFNTSGNMTVRCMYIYNNELYVSGGFFYAGDVPMQCIGIWNGDRWCGNSQEQIPNIPGTILFFNDTLYATSLDTLSGNFVNKLAKWTGSGTYYDTCSIAMSVDENNLSEEINIFPNPSNGEFTIISSANMEEISIYDISGKLIYVQSLNTKQSNIQLSLGSGMYFVRVKTENGMISKKISRY